MIYIVDTHTLIWYFTGDERLGKKAKDILKKGEEGRNEIIIPTIVLLEAIDIQEKKKIKFEMRELFEFIESKENFKVADLDFSLVKQIPNRAKGFDLHDRVIFIIGEIYKGIILTRDREIKKIAKTFW